MVSSGADAAVEALEDEDGAVWLKAIEKQNRYGESNAAWKRRELRYFMS